MQSIREIVAEAVPTKEQAHTYALVVGIVVLAGIISAFLSRRFKFARRLDYSSRECASLARLASAVVERLRKTPERTFRCPSTNGDALLRSLFVPPAATVAGYYDVMIGFQEFLRETISSKCVDGGISHAELADSIEYAVYEKCKHSVQ